MSCVKFPQADTFYFDEIINYTKFFPVINLIINYINVISFKEMVEGRKAPIADILHCYASCNRRKKRRSATTLGIPYYESGNYIFFLII